MTNLGFNIIYEAFFGIPTDLTQISLEYLADYVDLMDERAAIQTVFAMCATGTVSHHSRLLRFLFRKRLGFATLVAFYSYFFNTVVLPY